MKIALLGSAPSSVHRAPFKNSAFYAWAEGRQKLEGEAHGYIPGNFQIWGCSPAAWSVAPRATRWFEIHRWEPGQPWFSPEYCQFLREFPGPVYTGSAIPEIKNHVVYPIDQMEAKFSSYFFTSSLALMLALAIDTIEQVREARHAFGGVGDPERLIALGADPDEVDKNDDDDVIGMWGVDMAAAEEYGFQRPGCQFFVLEALRRGIGIYFPSESDLMRPMPVYGISEWDHNYIKLTSRARELSGKGNLAKQQIAEGEASLRHAEAGMGELNCFVQTWTSPYGLRHGLVIRQEPGTGLGSGVTHVDGRPTGRPLPAAAPAPVMQAMADSPETQELRRVREALQAYTRETGLDAYEYGTIERLAKEAALARQHTALLQQHMKPGESTLDAMARLFIPQGKVKKAGKRRR